MTARNYLRALQGQKQVPPSTQNAWCRGGEGVGSKAVGITNPFPAFIGIIILIMYNVIDYCMFSETTFNFMFSGLT